MLFLYFIVLCYTSLNGTSKLLTMQCYKAPSKWEPLKQEDNLHTDNMRTSRCGGQGLGWDRHDLGAGFSSHPDPQSQSLSSPLNPSAVPSLVSPSLGCLRSSWAKIYMDWPTFQLVLFFSPKRWGCFGTAEKGPGQWFSPYSDLSTQIYMLLVL